MKKSMVKNLKSIKSNIASEADKFTHNLYKTTRVFVKDASKEISKVDWEGMYKDIQKGVRSAMKGRNRMLKVTVKKIKKSDFYKGLTKDVPKSFLKFKKLTSKQLLKIQSMAARAFVQSKKWIENSSENVQDWVSDQYPKARKFVKANYPDFKYFMLNQFPTYRLLFTRRLM